MAANIFELDLANIFPGDEDPANSQHLTINNVKLPMLQEKTKDHMPGGGIFGLKIGMRCFDPLTVTFQLHGINPDVMNRFGVNTPARRKYTIRGNVRDLLEGTSHNLTAVVAGRMIKVDPASWQRDSGINHDYEIDEIVHYQLHLKDVEKYYWDFFGGPLAWRVDGVAQFAEEARSLGLA